MNHHHTATTPRTADLLFTTGVILVAGLVLACLGAAVSLIADGHLMLGATPGVAGLALAAAAGRWVALRREER